MLESESELQMVRRELATLATEIRELRKTCGRMDNHISFVERIYNTFRAPLEYIRTRLSRESDTLPQIE